MIVTLQCRYDDFVSLSFYYHYSGMHGAKVVKGVMLLDVSTSVRGVRRETVSVVEQTYRNHISMYSTVNIRRYTVATQQ